MEDVVAVDLGFWKDKRVLVTGHTGFKGAWLSLWLHRLGAKVHGYALAPPTDPSLYEQAFVADSLESTMGDVRDLSALRQCIQAAQPEVVFHLAAQSLVRESYQHPVDTFATNVMGTVNLLEALRGVESVRAAVIVTSDKCYENREWSRGYTEADAMGGHDPYSCSKGCAELVTASYRRSFFEDGTGASIATARAGNVIGGGDWAADRLVPDAIRALDQGESLLVRNPRATRPWQHVLEPLTGYMALAESLCAPDAGFGEAWNFGPDPGNLATVGDVCDGIQSRWGGPAAWVQDPGSHPHEAHSLKLDSTKARVSLGWSPVLDLEETLDWTVAWYKAHGGGTPAQDLVLRDIEAYESKLKIQKTGTTS